jgi:DNA-binding XRE family transcriptional regulator
MSKPNWDLEKEAAAFNSQLDHFLSQEGDDRFVSSMKPRTPALRLELALMAFQEEARKAFAEASNFEASKYDSGLELGELIRQHRKALNMTLAQLAEKAGCTKSHTWEIENGRNHNPTVKTVAGLSNALGLPLPLVFYAALRTTGLEK